MTVIACSLTTDQYRRRIADMGAVAQDALRSRAPIEGGVRHVFTAAPGVRDRLRGFVDAEAVCCPFLTLDLHDGNGGLILDVTGPEEARPVIDELFAA